MNSSIFPIVSICFLASIFSSWGETLKKFSSPDADHIFYYYTQPWSDTLEYSLLLADASDNRTVIASNPDGFSGTYRVEMSNPPYQVILRRVSETETNESVQLTLQHESVISGQAQFDENITVSEAVTSSGFSAISGVSVSVTDGGSNIVWQTPKFDGPGTITLNNCSLPSLSASDFRPGLLTLQSCKMDGGATFTATNVVVNDCLLNGGTTFNVPGSLEMSDSEVAGTCKVRFSGDVLLHNNTFYSVLELFDSTGPTVVRNNTALGGIASNSTGATVENNYYGAPWSTITTENGWLTPYHLDTAMCLDDGGIVRCSLTDPRNAPLFRSIRMAAGHSVMVQQSSTASCDFYPEYFTGRIRVGLPFAMSFDLKSSTERLGGVKYELVYDGVTYHPANPFTATARYTVDHRKDNADLTLNFILPAPTATGTNDWQLFADFSSCSANIVKPSPACVCIADGGIPIQAGFARPLRIGVMEIKLEDGSPVPTCDPRARSKAIARLKNDFVTKLGMTASEVEIVDLGYYTFTGGLLSSWFSQTDIGRANQLSSELEWFIGDYNAAVIDPLDFVVGVAPVNALGGADGLSQALRRHAVLVDEFSPDAALHEIGHSMGLYTKKEQYDCSSGYAFGGGFNVPARGLELGAMSAFNPSSKSSSVVAPGTVRHLPDCVHNGVYDVMGAANPHWISASTYSSMTDWLVDHLKLKTSTTSSALARSIVKANDTVVTANGDSQSSRIVHVAALYSRLVGNDTMLVPSIRIEEVVDGSLNNDGIYNLNYSFRSYDQDGNQLSAAQCTTPISDVVTNTLWQQTFSVPATATQYKLFHTSAPDDLGTYVVWTWNPAATLTNQLQVNYNAGSDAYNLTWAYAGTRREVENRLLMSDDNGVTWNPLPLPTYTNSISIPRAGLAKNNPQFKLLSSDGVHSVISAIQQGQPETALPPEISIISPLTSSQASTGTVWQLEAQTSDPNNDIASVKWISSKDGVLGNAASLTAELSAGNHQLSAIATDSTGLSATDTVNVVVGNLTSVDLSLATDDIRVAPLTNGCGLNAVGYGQTNTLDVTVRNQGISNLVQVQVYCTRPGESETSLYDDQLSLSPFDVRAVSLEFFAPSRGTYQIRAVCTPLDIPDSDAANNQVVVNYTNQPPQVFPNRLSVLDDSLPLRVPLAALDPNGDPVTFAIVPTAGAALAQNTLTFDNGGTPGSYPIQFTASDGDLTSLPATIIVDVYSTTVQTPAPVITSTNEFAANAGEWLQINITANNGPCTFSSSDLPTELYLDPATGQITGQITTAGTYQFSVTAQNGSGSDTAQITLQINAATTPPGDNFADAVELVGAPVDFQGSTTGATHETGEPNHAGMLGVGSIWWRWTAPSNGVVGIQWNSAYMPAAVAVYTGTSVDALTEVGSMFGFDAMTCFNAVAGQEYFIALDGFGEATFMLNLAYHAEPVLRAPSQVVAYQNQPVDLLFQTWNSATSFLATNLPAGLVLNPTTGHLTGSPSGYGYSTVAITTTNSAGSSTTEINFEIRSVNFPVITSPLYASATLDEPFSYQLVATHASSDTLYAGPLPEGLSFDSGTAFISGTPTESGTFTVYLSAGNTNTSEYINEELTLFVRTTYALWLGDCGFSVAEQSDPLVTGANADPDNDGASNYAEYIAGTDPRNPDDVLKATLRCESGMFSLEWPSKTDRCYTIQQAGSLAAEDFTVLSNNIPATPPLNAIGLSPAETLKFYRVQVQQ